MARYIELSCSSACHKLKSKFLPFHWDLNIYRGCEHRCIYCYALYSHRYLNSKAYFEEVFVKRNIVEQLEKQLASSRWKQEVINIGGVTDSYQPAEAKYCQMPKILRLLIKYRTPCIISTKSDLILRDYDLIAELAEITYVNIASTITCMEEGVRKKIERNSADSEKRFAMLQKFTNTKVSTGVHIMPVIPYLTDGIQNIEALYSKAKACNVSYVLSGMLHLRGETRAFFFQFIRKEFPSYYPSLLQLYTKENLKKAYKSAFRQKIEKLEKKYQLSDDYIAPMKSRLEKKKDIQFSLFGDVENGLS